MKARLSVYSLGSVFLTGILAWSLPASVDVRREVYLMGTRATLETDARDRSSGIGHLEKLLRVLEEAEQDLSTWRKGSAISRFNAQPVGVPFPLDAPLCRLFSKLEFWTGRTGGVFDPAIGALIEAWGLRAGGRHPTDQELRRARRNAGFRHLDVGIERCQLTRNRAVQIDVGGFGKGEALDRALDASLTAGIGPWMISLGGQVMVHSVEARPRSWHVALAHPRHRDQPLLTLEIRDGSLATSSGSERDLAVGSGHIGHILDPRTGLPVQRDIAATVWHSRALEADILSTALYVMGVEEGLAWAEKNQVAAVFLIPAPDGRVELQASSIFREAFF